MKGDFSRRTFDPADRYSAVLQEMGRMLTDADLEEEHRILEHRIETEAADLIGGCGGPIANAGFEISASGSQFQIGEGRYYAGGILVANDEEVDFTEQPFRPDVPWPPADAAVRYLVYLDVWRRLVTALDDPSIREVALGGPTTSAREQTVWQVRLSEVDDDATCLLELPDFGDSTGTLAAQADPEAAATDPCEVPPSAGFKGLENQFYRVEVHGSGDAYDLTAAADTFAVTGIPAGTTNELTLAAVAGLTVGDAVEVYSTVPGSNPLEATFGHLTDVDPATGIVTLSTDLPGFSLADAPQLRLVEASFVWSRDNGSVVTTIERIDGVEVTVRDLGADDVLGFAPGQWVEISDDRNVLEMRPGQLLRVESIDTQRRILTLATDAQQLDNPPDGSGINPDWHPKLRRWEGAGAIRFNNLAPGTDWIHLEDGVQVRFSAGHYRSGDYWHFPARTATADPDSGNIEWPHDAAGDPELLSPHGVEHTYCRLAMLDVVGDGDGGFTTGEITDCRNLFPEVTKLTNLLYVGGDGQEGLPDPASPASREVALGAPLQVRVSNGSYPVAGARVQFEITASSNGRLEGVNNKVAVIDTDADGIASCEWELDGSTLDQFCEARLLDVAGDPFDHQAVNFHANLSTAARVSYDPSNCQNLAGVKTVQEALDALCRTGGGGGGCCCVVVGPGKDFEDIQSAIDALLDRGERDICLCLVPGDHELPGMTFESKEPERGWTLSISGCGPGTRLNLLDDMRLIGLAAFALSDLDIDIRQGATIHATQCRDVKVDGCLLSGFPPKVGLLRIHFASRIYVGNSTFESFVEPTLESAFNFFDGFSQLMELYTLQSWREFDRMARRVAIDLAQRDHGDRVEIADELQGRLDGSSGFMTLGEAAAHRRFISALRREEVDPLALFDHLVAIRRAALRFNPGIAIEIGELVPGRETVFEAAGTRAGDALVENNAISGIVSLYGVGSIGREIDPVALRQLRNRLQNPPDERRVTLAGLDLAFHFRNNRLAHFIVSDALIDELERLGNEEVGELDILIDSLHCTDNVIESATSQLVARHLSLATNEFSLAAIRGNDPGSTMSMRIVDAVADSSVYTGNHGAHNGFGVTFNADIFNATRVMAEAANLEINII